MHPVNLNSLHFTFAIPTSANPCTAIDILHANRSASNFGGYTDRDFSLLCEKGYYTTRPTGTMLCNPQGIMVDPPNCTGIFLVEIHGRFFKLYGC